MKRLFAAAAFAPLCFAAVEAQAQTTVSDARTTPLATSTTGNLEITSSGSVEVKTGGPAITVDSDNTVKATGGISVRDSTNGVGILVTTPAGGRTTTIDLNGNIAADDTVANTDTDKDGDLDGPFVPDAAVTRYGVRVTGTGPLIGNITQTAGTIAVEGNNGSSGISIETGLTGNLRVDGVVGVLGTNAAGVRVTGPVNGSVEVGGGINAQGEGAVGLSLDGPVSGILRIDGAVTAYGYRYQDQNNTPVDPAKLDADDLLLGGPAVRLSGNLGRGFLLDAKPTETDAADTDEDNDGRADAEETNGIIRSFGVAPALLIGHATNAVTVSPTLDGQAPTFGVIINGQVIGTGAFNGFNGTAARIGGLGGTVDVQGGIRLSGQIQGEAYQANANGLIIGSGTTVPQLVMEGGAISAGVNTIEGTFANSRALTIEAGASLPTITNTGRIAAGVVGPAGNSVAVLDQSGTLSSITNRGLISATVTSGVADVTATGDRIALDLRANTTGVTVTQLASPTTGSISAINGDILFGTGAYNDTLDLSAGSSSGAIDFGGGLDILTLGATTDSRADLRKSSGALEMNVQGDLTLTNTTRVAGSNLQLGTAGALTFTADPQNADPLRRVTFLDLTGSATFAAGSVLDIEFVSKLDGPTTFEVLRAATVTNNGVGTGLVSDLPYIFSGSARVNSTSVLVDVRPRTTDELGLESGRAAAYDAFYAAFDTDPAVANSVLSKTNRADFNRLFDQFLPDYSGGAFNSLANSARAVYQAQGEKVSGMLPGEPRSWLQEVGVGTKFESISDIDYQTAGFGVAGGVEKPYGDGDSAYGISASYITSEIRNANRALGSVMTGAALMGSAYWRGEALGLDLDASASVGYAWFDSERRVVDQLSNGTQNFIRQANSDWGGVIAGGRLGAAYDWEAGAFYVRYDGVVDAVYLGEGSYRETGGGDAVNLNIASRDTYELAAEAGILIGAEFGRGYRWGPEIRVAYRSELGSGGGETAGYFVSTPGQTFVLPGMLKDRNRVVVRAALRGRGVYSNFAFEASGDIGEIYQAYMARFAVRFLF